MMAKPVNEIHESLLRYMEIYKNIDISESCSKQLSLFLPLVVERSATLGEIFESSLFLFEEEDVRLKKVLALLDDCSIKTLVEFVAAIGSINLTWNTECLNKFINTYCQRNNLKFRDIGVPLRIALTGSTSSPSIVHIMEILGEQETLDRLNLIID